MCITGYYVIEIPIAIFYFVTAILFMILHCYYKHDERELAGKSTGEKG